MAKVLMIIAAVVLLLAAAVGLLLCGYTMSIHPQSLEEARAWQEDHYDLSWYDPLEKQDYTVESYDGYLLHVQRLVNPGGSGRFVILSHGYTDNRLGALKYAKIYLDLGYQVIVYDLRGHGENEATFCTYSARESRDLLALVQDTRSRYPELVTLGIHGESLGAATTVACLRYQPQVDFAVADCPFADIATVLKDGLRSARLPTFLVDLASLGAKVRFGYSYDDMRPIDGIETNQVPILFFHGEEDTFIRPEHSLRLQQAAVCRTERYVFPGAGHAESVLKDRAEYAGHVTAFLAGLGLTD